MLERLLFSLDFVCSIQTRVCIIPHHDILVIRSRFYHILQRALDLKYLISQIYLLLLSQMRATVLVRIYE